MDRLAVAEVSRDGTASWPEEKTEHVSSPMFHPDRMDCPSDQAEKGPQSNAVPAARIREIGPFR